MLQEENAMETKPKSKDSRIAQSADTQSAPVDEVYIKKLFNLEDKNISKIHVNHQFDGVHVHVELECAVHTCPVCGTETSIINNYVNKKITHSILNGIPCYINYHARRHRCPACNKTFYEHNPFTIEGMKISLATVYNVLKDLKSFNETFTSVAARYNISATAVASIFDRHVRVSRRKLPEYICIDEVYAFKSDRSNYVCVLLDYESQKLIDLLPSRKKQDLITYFTLIPREEREKVKIVSTDMWETYRIVSKFVFPNAVTACDKFHVIQEMTKRVDRIRIDVMNRVRVPSNLKKENLTKQEIVEVEERQRQYYVLKKFNWLLYKNDAKIFDPNVKKHYNRMLKGYYNHYDLLDYIIKCDKSLEEAVDLKDELIRFYKKSSHEKAKKDLEEIIKMYQASDIKVINEFAKTLIKWKYEIINSFIKIDKNERKINNGIIENRNKTIKNIKHNANGYGNWERFRSRVLYVINDDVTYYLYPIKND